MLTDAKYVAVYFYCGQYGYSLWPIWSVADMAQGPKHTSLIIKTLSRRNVGRTAMI